MLADDLAILADDDAGHGEAVLIIDDEGAIRMLVVEVLTEAG